jgi:RNA polymerase sigma-70 factor (ECF subfamily)
LHNQRGNYERDIPLTAWIHAIARYKLIDFLRRHGRQDALSEPLTEALDEEAALQQDGGQESMHARRDLSRLLDLLPAAQREAIVHMKVDGWTVKETATAMQVSESWVKVAVHRGLKSLAARMGAKNENR